MELVGSTEFHLGGLDYVLFVLMFAISFLIGIYYGFLSKNKQNTPDEYIFGSKRMGAFPISISVIASSLSGITIIGHSAEVYAHGTQHWQYVFSFSLTILATSYVLLPIFYDLQLPSSFSYLELRFGRPVQRLASFMYLVISTLYVSISIYIPALVLNHLAGISIPIIIVVSGCVCIFYTTIGGFRAVIWTDLFQAFLMVVCCIAICYIGLGLIGGIDETWEASKRGNRLILFNFNPDPTVRVSTWTILLGHSFISIQMIGINQSSVQRFLSMSSIAKARKALYFVGLELIFFIVVTIGMGLLFYAYYETCDPLSTGRIQKLDQIPSLFISEIANHFPGLPGIFVAGIFSASLSTMSSSLNSSTVCLYEDFLRPFLPNMSDEMTCKLLKLITLLLGCVEIALVFVVMKLGTVFTIFMVLFGVTGGTMIGLFAMGMLLPKANQKGALTGTISSMIGVGSIIIGSLFKKPEALLPMRTDGCQYNFTSPVADAEDSDDDLLWIFRISFMYFGTVGLILVFLIGYPVSLLTGGNEIKDQRLLATFIRKKTPDLLKTDALEHFLPETTINPTENEETTL